MLFACRSFVTIGVSLAVLGSASAGLVSAEASSFGASWQMNDTAGGMTDSSGNGNVGVLHSVARDGSTYGFDGASSYVSVPSS